MHLNHVWKVLFLEGRTQVQSSFRGILRQCHLLYGCCFYEQDRPLNHITIACYLVHPNQSASSKVNQTQISNQVIKAFPKAPRPLRTGTSN